MAEIRGGFDFSELGQVGKRQNEGVAVHIRHPARGPLFFENGSGPKPVIITVVGTYSETYRTNERERLDAIASGKRTTTGMFETTEQLASACVGWDGFLDGGEPVPFTREKVAEILKSEPWIAEQLVLPSREHERFFSQGSAS